jgi:hypothetical protein
MDIARDDPICVRDKRRAIRPIETPFSALWKTKRGPGVSWSPTLSTEGSRKDGARRLEAVWHHWRSGSYQFPALFFLAVVRAAILETGGNCALRKFPIQFLSRNCKEHGTTIFREPRQKRFTEFRLNLRGPTSPFAAGIPVANQLF